MARPDRRAQLLDAARAVIAEDGLVLVTMERIAARAGVSKPVLYSHFDNRDRVLVALLEEFWADVDAGLEARLRRAQTFDDQLEALVVNYFERLAAGGAALQGLIMGWLQEPAVVALRAAHNAEVEARWAARYQEHLGLTPAVSRVAATVVRMAVAGAGEHWLGTPGASRQRCIDTCLAIVRGGLNGLAPGGPSRP